MTRILVVDDRPDVRLSLKLMLEASGFDCSEAASGDEALDQLKNERIDFVLTDLLMPGMDGASLIRAIRQQLPKSPRIIAMTGADHLERENVVKEAAAQRPDTILLKPFSLRQLVGVMRNLTAAPSLGLRGGI